MKTANVKTVIAAGVPLPQPIPTHDGGGTGTADSSAAAPVTAGTLPWQRTDGGVTQQLWTPRHHPIAGLAIGGSLGLVLGFLAGCYLDGSPHGFSERTVWTTAIATLAAGLLAGPIVGSCIVNRHLVADRDYSPAKATAADVTGLVGHSLGTTPTLDEAANCTILAHAPGEYVVDRVVAVNADRGVLTPQLYSTDARAAARDDDHVRALVQLDEGAGTNADRTPGTTWVVVDLHHDATAAANSRMVPPHDERWSAWKAPMLDAITAHVTDQVARTATIDGATWNIVERSADVAVLDGWLDHTSAANNTNPNVDVLERGTPVEVGRTYASPAPGG